MGKPPGAQVSKRARVYFRVTQQGTLQPADISQSAILRERKYRVGDLLAAELTKPRNPKFNGLVHKLGQLVTQNIDAFTGIDAHKAIKRLQLEGKIACDEIAIQAPGFGMLLHIVPRSLSFDSMDEAEFNEAAQQICRFIADRYWPDCSPSEIERIAQCMVTE